MKLSTNRIGTSRRILFHIYVVCLNVPLQFVLEMKENFENGIAEVGEVKEKNDACKYDLIQKSNELQTRMATKQMH